MTGRSVALVAVLALAACGRRRATPAPAPRDAGARSVDASAVERRRLTAGEIAMVRPIFRGAVDYARVEVVHDTYAPFQPETIYMTPDDHIYAPALTWYADFAAPEVPPGIQAAFVHEMVHVWQHQSGVELLAEGMLAFARSGGDYARAYAYTLGDGRDLLDYGIEQQASILEDRYLIQRGYYPESLANMPADWTAVLPLYTAVLARFDADPTYGRRRRPL